MIRCARFLACPLNASSPTLSEYATSFDTLSIFCSLWKSCFVCVGERTTHYEGGGGGIQRKEIVTISASRVARLTFFSMRLSPTTTALASFLMTTTL